MSMLAVPTESANESVSSITPSISSISLNTGKEIKKPQGNRKTKIVATIGPKTQTVEALSSLIKAGMNVARMNFSHGDHSFHETTVRNVREASRITGKVCAILLDNKGPEIRTGKMKDNGDKGPVWLLKQGQPLEIHCTLDPDFRGDDTKIAMDYVNMPKVVKIGAVIKIGDGLLQCVVQRVQDQVVHTIVANTCEISNHKGVNLPGARVDLPALTPRDELDLQFAVKHQVDFFAASFVRKAADVTTIRSLMAEEGKDIKIIAKIESQEGLDNFDQILSVADGIMVARGDLGVEIPIQKVCMAQKMMIRKSNIVGKPVITATQMLESMITNPRPTRAEATDVANAVFDGTDCVMLSGETAKGDYPVEAVQVMSQICRSAEEAFDYDNFFVSMLYHSRKRMNKAEAIASSAVKTAHDLSVPLIFVMTESGSTARAVSKYKPKIPVITLTTNPRTARQCMVSRALYPICVPADKIAAAAPEPAVYGGHSVTGALHFGYEFAKKKRWVEVGDETVLVSGLVHGVSGGTNTLKVLSVE